MVSLIGKEAAWEIDRRSTSFPRYSRMNQKKEWRLLLS